MSRVIERVEDIKDLNPDYAPIIELWEKLKAEHIPCGLEVAFDGFVLRGIYGDVAMHEHSFGLEAYKFDECNHDVLEDLEIDEALELFINEYEKYGGEDE